MDMLCLSIVEGARPAFFWATQGQENPNFQSHSSLIAARRRHAAYNIVTSHTQVPSPG